MYQASSYAIFTLLNTQEESGRYWSFRVPNFQARKGYCNLIGWHATHTCLHVTHTDFFLQPDQSFAFLKVWEWEIQKHHEFLRFHFPRSAVLVFKLHSQLESCTLCQDWIFLTWTSSTYRKGFIMNTYTPDMGTWMSYHRTKSGVHFCINICSYPMENVRQLTLRRRASSHPWQHSFLAHSVLSSHSHITGRSQEVACPVFHVQVHR